MSKYAFLFPGQGAQYPGMGKDFAKEFSQARQLYEEADDCLNESVSRIVFEGPEDLLTQTKYSQLGIFITSAAILKVLRSQFPSLRPQVCSGLSLGEYTALYASERLGFIDTLRLVRERSRLMNEACERTSGAMAAVLGLDAIQLEKVISGVEGVWVANYNCPGQIVISGTMEGVERVSPLLKLAGAKRVIPLSVHGAFHSGLMQTAQDGLGPYIEASLICDSSIQFVMNVPGSYVYSKKEVRDNLKAQVTHSVRWEQGIRAMDHIDVFFEIGCGKTLTGLNKKIGVSSQTISIEKIEDLDRIGEILCSSS